MRNQPRRFSPSMTLILRSAHMLVCTFGDLTLDVIVRLADPLAAEATRTRRSRRPGGPGGQRRGLGGGARRDGSRSIGKRGDDEAGPPRARRARGDGCRGCRAGRGPKRGDLLARLPGRRALDGSRPRRRRARFAPDEIDPAWLEGCDHLFVSGYALLLEPARSAALRAAELAQSAGIRGQRRPRNLERDPRRRSPPSSAKPCRSSRPTSSSRTNDEEEIFGGPLPGTQWILKRGARGCSFDGDERPALPVAGRRHDRRGRRARRGVDRRRARPRARSGRPLRPAARRDARR